jgi:hypothetical protein
LLQGSSTVKSAEPVIDTAGSTAPKAPRLPVRSTMPAIQKVFIKMVVNKRITNFIKKDLSEIF